MALVLTVMSLRLNISKLSKPHVCQVKRNGSYPAFQLSLSLMRKLIF